MRVLVASGLNSRDPSASTAERLTRALRDRGHEVDRVMVPFAPGSDVGSQLVAVRLTDLSDLADLLVAVGMPAHLLTHRRKVLWIGKADPGVGTGAGDRGAFEAAERLACAEAQLVAAATPELCARLAPATGREAVLLPIPDEADADAWARIVVRLTEAPGAAAS